MQMRFYIPIFLHLVSFSPCALLCVSAQHFIERLSPAGIKTNTDNVMVNDSDCRNHKALDTRHGSFAVSPLPKATQLNFR